MRIAIVFLMESSLGSKVGSQVEFLTCDRGQVTTFAEEGYLGKVL